MTPVWNSTDLALHHCPVPLRPAVTSRLEKTSGWSPWAPGSLPTNPFIVMALRVSAEIGEAKPSPDGWRWLGEWEPQGELFALLLHYPDCEAAWILLSTVDEAGAPTVINLCEMIL